MNVQQAVTLGAELLKEAQIEDPMRDARRLMAAFLQVEPGRLTLLMQDDFDPLTEENYFAAILERKARRPLSHLLGYRDFYGRRFSISSDVLDPRGDTETLVAAALDVPFDRVLDLGTGSGCILLTLLAEREGATGVGSDISEAALDVATRNAVQFELQDRVSLVPSNWFKSISGRYDLIVSNPPYISSQEMQELAPELSYEPRQALTDEGDGLSAYRILTRAAQGYLTPGGQLMVEIGWTQGEAVKMLFEQAGFADVTVLPDLDGRDRVVTGKNRQ